MILVDTSVWIDHLRRHDEVLARQLETGSVLIHPLIIGELAMGSFRQRAIILDSLKALPQATRAMDEEMLDFIEAAHLHGRGIGYIDAHLLASAKLSAETLLWTADKRLAAIAGELSVSFDPARSA